jgi:hypothetical protein
VEDPLAEEIVNSSLEENDEIFMDYDDGSEQLKIEIKKKKKSADKKTDKE